MLVNCSTAIKPLKSNIFWKLFKIKRELSIRNCNVVLILDNIETLTFILLFITENSLTPVIKNSLNIIKIEGINKKLSIELKNNNAQDVNILSDIGSKTFPKLEAILVFFQLPYL